MTDPPIVVTLVHGTWGRYSTWFRSVTSNGVVSSQLSRMLNLEHAEHRHFSWSGRNGLRARFAASRGLATFLQEGFDKHPNAQHFLIAHSHGGTLTAYTLVMNPSLETKLDGVICIGTPFPHAEWRRNGTTFIGVFASLCALVIGFTSFLWLSGHTAGSLFNTWAPWLGSAAITILCWIISGLVNSKERELLARVYLKSNRDDTGYSLSNSYLSLHGLDPSKFLIVRQPGDEAGHSLATASFLSSFLRRSGRLISLSRWIHNWFVKSDTTFWELFSAFVFNLMMAAFFLGTMIILAVLLLLNVQFPATRPWLIGFIGSIIVIVWLSAFVERVLLFLSALVNIAYGIDAVRLGDHISLHSEISPPGEWQVVVVPHRIVENPCDIGGSFLDDPNFLRHTRWHYNREILKTVASWIHSRVGNVSNPGLHES